MLLAGRTSDHLVEITFTTLAAYGSFYLAEHLHLSGVLAALTAGLVVGNYGAPSRISSSGRHALEIFWEYVAFIANSLIFLLIVAQEAQEHFGGLWVPILVAIALVTLGRAVAIYPVCALFGWSRLEVNLRHQHILFWGGLRGALALAPALALPAGPTGTPKCCQHCLNRGAGTLGRRQCHHRSKRCHGFLAAEIDNRDLHLWELAMRGDVQGRGIGRQLIHAAELCTRERHLHLLTLTTFSDVPWNAPWYSRMGFEMSIGDGRLEALVRAE